MINDLLLYILCAAMVFVLYLVIGIPISTYRTSQSKAYLLHFMERTGDRLNSKQAKCFIWIVMAHIEVVVIWVAVMMVRFAHYLA